MSPGTVTAYAWLEIFTLPLKFICSEFFMFNREQLVWIAKCHRILMVCALTFLSVTLVVMMIHAAGSSEAQRTLRELDKHDVRIAKIESELAVMQIDQAVIKTAFVNLTDTLKWVLNILGVIATTLLLQFAAAVFKMKWGAALRDTITQEYDRRKIKEIQES
jgi:hypothetical protein